MAKEHILSLGKYNLYGIHTKREYAQNVPGADVMLVHFAMKQKYFPLLSQLMFSITK